MKELPVLPTWWTNQETQALMDNHALNNPIDGEDERGHEAFKCRCCAYWKSNDGNGGECTGPKLEADEQFYPRLAPPTQVRQACTDQNAWCDAWQPRLVIDVLGQWRHV